MADYVVTVRALAPVVTEIQVYDVRGSEAAKRDAVAGVAADIKLLRGARVDVGAGGTPSEVQVLDVEKRLDRRARRPLR